MAALTSTGCSMDTKVQKRPLSSCSALLRACVSVSSSTRYLLLTPCMAPPLCSRRSPFPAGTCCCWLRPKMPVVVAVRSEAARRGRVHVRGGANATHGPSESLKGYNYGLGAGSGSSGQSEIRR